MIDLNDMVIFARVVECGSISGAARDLAQPKSTISRRVKRLEEQLSVRLLQRTTRSLKLTELGAAFYERCCRLQELAEEAEHSVSLGQDRPKGKLRISGPAETGISQLGVLIAEYSRLYPEVQIELDLSNRFVDLVEEGYDLAIRAGELADSTLVARRLAVSRMVLCASPAYVERFGDPASPDELKQHRLLLYGNTLKKYAYTFNSINGLASVQLSPTHTANSLSVLRDMVKMGMGITLLPNHHTQRDVDRGDLVLLMKAWRLPEHGVYILYPSARHLTPKVRSFIDFFCNQFDIAL